ncbi:hypothetical protein GQX74_008000 [Glossina fuscipes]|nr:hypothetical protein GQX74_008000 [Glossina fuscipes]
MCGKSICLWPFNLLAVILLILLPQQQQHVVCYPQHVAISSLSPSISYAPITATDSMARSATAKHSTFIEKREVNNNKLNANSRAYIPYENDRNSIDDAYLTEEINYYLQEIRKFDCDKKLSPHAKDKIL